MKQLGMRPRRTVRVVLWTNEENGLAGGRTYARDHARELDQHVAAIETDSGGFRPVGFAFEVGDKSREKTIQRQLEAIAPLMSSIGPIRIHVGHSGADVSPMRGSAAVLMGLEVDDSTYFDYHHTNADTLDKVDPKELAQDTAAIAALAWILAD